MIALHPSKFVLALGVGLAVTSVGIRPSSALPARKSHATMVMDAVDTYVIPHTEKLAAVAASLKGAVGRVCESKGSEEAHKAATLAFADTVKAWAALDFVRFGPVARAHRLERIFFWPDPRDFAWRQLNGLLAARKPELLAPGALASQSVAVQGLTALEILLFSDKISLGAGSDEASLYRCGLAHAIAANIQAVADELVEGWTGTDGYRMKMLAPGSDNPLYRDAGETSREVVKSLAMGIELARDRFILPELTAVTAKPPRRVRLAFERADLTGVYLEATIASLRELFDSIGLAAYVPVDKPWMGDFLPNAWNSLRADVKKLDGLRASARGSEAHVRALRKMRFDLSGIRQIIFKELAFNAGVEMGINELDGD